MAVVIVRVNGREWRRVDHAPGKDEFQVVEVGSMRRVVFGELINLRNEDEWSTTTDYDSETQEEVITHEIKTNAQPGRDSR